MKNIFSFLAMALLLVSCSSDDFNPAIEGTEQVVNLTVQLPEQIQSRGIGGVNSALGGVSNTNGEYEFNVALFYQDDMTSPAWVGTAKAEAGSKHVTLSPKLVLGKNYKLVAYASTVSQNWEGNGTVSNIALSTALNDETEDAYSCVTNIVAEAQMSVTLTRPFGKLRIITNDYQQAIQKHFKKEIASIKIEYTQAQEMIFNPITGKFETSANDITIFEDADFNGSKAGYTEETGDTKTLVVDYVPVPEAGKLLNFTVTVTFEGGDTFVRTIKQDIPLKRNYLTTLSGNFFLSDAQLDVYIEEEFTSTIEAELWDGQSIEEVTPVDGVYNIENPAQLAWVAQQVNSGNTFENSTVVLINNLNLGYYAWTPIGLDSDTNNVFKGIFDGNKKTITNLYIKQGPAYQGAGLFGSVAGTIKNFTIENATINNLIKSSSGASSNGTAVVAGALYDEGDFKGIIDGVTVKNATVVGNRYVAGIAGYCYGEVKNCVVDGIELTANPDNFMGSYDNGDKVGAIAGYAVNTISGCSVNDATIKGYRDLGGIAGKATADLVTNNNVTNSSIIVDQVTISMGAKAANAAPIVGRVDNTVLGEGNSYSNVTITNVVSETQDLKTLIEGATSELNIALTPGTYTYAQINVPSAYPVTIQGGEGVVFDGQFFMGSGNLTLKDLTITNANATTSGISKAANNAVYVQGEGVFTAENCVFNVAKATAITTWWSSASTNPSAKWNNVIVKNCTFNCNGNRALQIEGNATIEGCTINDPYRYVAQLTAGNTSSETVVINFKNNTIGQSTTSGKPTYGLQLTCDYGNENMIINGSGNTIQNRDSEDALYVWECGTGVSSGKVDLSTITLNATDGKLYLVEGDLATALTQTAEINLLAGTEYIIPAKISAITGSKVTITGVNKDAVISFNSTPGGADGGLNSYADNTELVFKNITVNSPNTGSSYTGGFGRAASVVFEGCAYNGQYRTMGPTTFTNCVIDPMTSYIYTDYYNVDFTNCDFNCSEGKGIQVYNDGASTNTTINVNGCSFTAAKQAQTWDGKPVTAIDINSIGAIFTVNINNTTTTGFATGLYSGNELWNIKGGAEYITVNVDGVQVD